MLQGLSTQPHGAPLHHMAAASRKRVEEEAPPELLDVFVQRLPQPVAEAFHQHLAETVTPEDLKKHRPLVEKLVAAQSEAQVAQLKTGFSHLTVQLQENFPAAQLGGAQQYYLESLKQGGTPDEVLQRTVQAKPVIAVAASEEAAEQLATLKGLESGPLAAWLSGQEPEAQVDRLQGLARLCRAFDPGASLQLVQKLEGNWTHGLATAIEVAQQMGTQPEQQLGLVEQLVRIPSLTKVKEALQAGPAWDAHGTWAIADGSWSDSPNGKYLANQNVSLLTPEIDLSSLKEPTLSASYRFYLESWDDFVYLEASTDGEEWDRLQLFTGDHRKAGSKVWDLSPYEGKKVQLRLRLTSDGGTEYEGFHLDFLRVSGRDSETDQVRVPLWFESDGKGPKHFLEHYEAAPTAQREQMLESLKALNAGLNDLGAATRLLPLAPEPQRAADLGRLARRSDLETAEQIWPRAATVEELDHELKLWDAACAMLPESGGAARRQLQSTLSDLKLSPEEAGLLERAARRAEPQAPWAETNGWGRTKDADGFMVWQDSPDGNYRGNANNSMVTPFLDLAGLSSPFLSYEAKTKLEQNDDYFYVDASLDGKEWQRLRWQTGNSDWGEHKIDLSQFEGRRVKLRFRIQTDSGTEYDGISLKTIRLRGYDETGRGRNLLVVDEGNRESRDFVPLLADRSPESRLSFLNRLEGLTQKLGLPAASMLMSEVEHMLGSSPEEIESLSRLAQEVGVRGAVSLWPFISRQEELAEAVEEAISTHDLVLSAVSTDAKTPPREAEALALKLMQSRPSAEELKLIRDLADRLDGGMGRWTTDGWGREPNPDRGSVVTESPGGRYPDSSTRVLESEVLDLRRATRPVLRFERAFELEQGDDWVKLEWRKPLGEWTRLANFTGNSGWKGEELDLSALKGQHAQLRFKFSSDSGTVYDGFKLSSLEVRDQGQPLLRLQTDLPAFGELLELFELTPREERRELLSNMLLMAEEADMQTAFQLRNLVSTPEEATQLGRLAKRFGTEAAEMLWKQKLDPALADVSQRLHEVLGETDDPQYWTESAQMLAKMGVTPEQLQPLVELAVKNETLAPTQLPSQWGQELDENLGVVWSDSPGGRYPVNSNNSLVLGEFSLWQKQNPKLSFELKHSLEKGDDHLRVETRVRGEDWKQLTSYTGNSDWHSQDLDLSSLQGRRFELRLRLTGDSNNMGDGAQLARIRLTAEGLEGPETLYQFEPGKATFTHLLEVVKEEPERNLEILTGMAQDFGGLRPALTVWPAVARAFEGGRAERDLEMIQKLAGKAGPLATVALAESFIGREDLPKNAEERLLGLAKSRIPLAGAGWVAGKILEDSDGEKVGDAIQALGAKAPQVLSYFEAHAAKVLNGRTLARALDEFARFSVVEEGELAEVLGRFAEREVAPEVEIGENSISIGGQTIEVN